MQKNIKPVKFYTSIHIIPIKENCFSTSACKLYLRGVFLQATFSGLYKQGSGRVYLPYQAAVRGLNGSQDGVNSDLIQLNVEVGSHTPTRPFQYGYLCRVNMYLLTWASFIHFNSTLKILLYLFLPGDCIHCILQQETLRHCVLCQVTFILVSSR